MLTELFIAQEYCCVPTVSPGPVGVGRSAVHSHDQSLSGTACVTNIGLLTCGHKILHNFHKRNGADLKLGRNNVNTWGNDWAKFHAKHPSLTHPTLPFPKKNDF